MCPTHCTAPSRQSSFDQSSVCIRSAIRRTANPDLKTVSPAGRPGRVEPDELAYELMIEGDGKGMLYLPVTNFASGNLDVVGDMIDAPNPLIGLGDGGALSADALDAIGDGRAVPGVVGDQAAGGRQCRGDRAE